MRLVLILVVLARVRTLIRRAVADTYQHGAFFLTRGLVEDAGRELGLSKFSGSRVATVSLATRLGFGENFSGMDLSHADCPRDCWGICRAYDFAAVVAEEGKTARAVGSTPWETPAGVLVLAADLLPSVPDLVASAASKLLAHGVIRIYPLPPWISIRSE